MTVHLHSTPRDSIFGSMKTDSRNTSGQRRSMCMDWADDESLTTELCSQSILKRRGRCGQLAEQNSTLKINTACIKSTGYLTDRSIRRHTDQNPEAVNVFLPVLWWKKPWKPGPEAVWCWISSYTQCYQPTKTRIPCSVQMLVMSNLRHCCGSEQWLAGVQASSGAL